MLKDQFRGHLSREINRGFALEGDINRISSEESLKSLEERYEVWNEYNKQLLQQGIAHAYQHYFQEFEQLDTALGNVHAGEMERRLNRMRQCIYKKNVYLQWMLQQLNSLPSEVFVIFEIKEKRTSITNKTMKKLFISHASVDHEYIGEFIDLLKSIGVKQGQIFCTSFEGYSIDLGEDFLDRIKDELGNDIVTLFMLSHNFFASPICLCEMGATWVNSKTHIPVLLPPFEFKDIKGVIPGTQGLKINDSVKLSSLKDKIEREFSIEPIHVAEWERSKSKFLKAIEVLLSKSNFPPKA